MGPALGRNARVAEVCKDWRGEVASGPLSNGSCVGLRGAMVGRLPGMVSGWSGARRVAPAPAIVGSAEVFIGGRERVAGNFAGGRSGALSMASAAMSSSDDVYGDPFLGSTLPPNGPLPLSVARLPSVGPGGLGEVGRFKAGSRLGLIAPGIEGAPDWPELSSPRDILRA